jgi:predicted hydrocarbon binding protein
VGKHAAERLRKMFGIEGLDLLSVVFEVSQTTGWGIYESRDIDLRRNRGTIIIRECFEAQAWRKKPYKACHWSRGYAAGVMSVVFGRPVEATEVKCLAAGDEYCEFRIRPEPP